MKKVNSVILAVLLLMTLITVSCKKKISKADLEYQVGQSVSAYFKENLSANPYLKSVFETNRLETKVTLIKESEHRYAGNAVLEFWKNDEHGGDGPGTKEAEEKYSIVVIVDPDDGSFRWEIQN